MPYVVRKVAKGYKVADAKPLSSGRYKYYSKAPMSWDEAHKQFVALQMSAMRKGEKPNWAGGKKPRDKKK